MPTLLRTAELGVMNLVSPRQGTLQLHDERSTNRMQSCNVRSYSSISTCFGKRSINVLFLLLQTGDTRTVLISPTRIGYTYPDFR